MKLVVIFGPHAVGKMTVGQELSKITGLKLFHNHMTIDVVSDVFDSMPAERNRLTDKPTKRNLEKSERIFRTIEEKYRLNSLPGEIQKEHYIRIDNTHLSPAAAAQMIRDAFQL